MSKTTKSAEKALTDADKFPIESFRERLSRRFGIDAVALSGPCEGQSLVECIVRQLEKRWDRIKDRFAGDNNKAFKLATKLAESYQMKDDTKDCISDLEQIGYQKTAANGIASYLKAYAMDPAADMEMDKAMDTVMDEPADNMMEPAADAGVAPAADKMVTIDLPMEVAEQLKNQIETNMPKDEAPMMEEPMEIEVIDLTPGGELHGDVEDVSNEIVPGEPAGEMDDHKVEGEHSATCEACGATMASAGHRDEEKKSLEGLKEDIKDLEHHEEKEKKGEESESEHEDKEKDIADKMHDKMKPFEKKDDAEKKENEEFGEEVYKEAASKMRAGHIKAAGMERVAADGIARLAPEMKLNNTDQIGPHEGKELGAAKEKSPEDPKAISSGNLETEGHSAGDKKFQDKSTMGHEEKFDAKEFDKASATGGKASIMGKDESFPEAKPQVPAGSAPIGGEQFQGGDLSTKGTVIAKIKPDGVHVEADGKKYRAKGEIKAEMVEKVQAGLAKIAEGFTGDGKAFAQAALKVIKEAEKSGTVEEVTKTDTGKLEGDKFTNDADKKPADGGAMTSKGKAANPDEGVCKIDTGKLEGEKFTNDADKKAEAAAVKETKTAKPVEEPKALEDGNVKPEGYTANDSHFSDGKTMGHEEKFDAKKVDKGEVSKGSASEMGKDEEFPTGKADVPAGGGKMGNEQFDGGNVSTKGTTIAENSQKREVGADDLQSKLNEATIKEARLKAASVYVADLLANGDIERDEYASELEKAAQMTVPAIQNLIAQTRKMRARIASNAAEAQKQQDGKTAGLSIPVVRTASSNEMSLKDRLVREFRLTRKLDEIDGME